MEPTSGFISGFNPIGPVSEESGLELLQFRDEIHRLMPFPQENSSSFTALLELPATQAIDLLHSPNSVRDPTTAKFPALSLYNSLSNDHRLHFQPLDDQLTSHTDRLTVEKAAKLPAFAGESSMETLRSLPSNILANLENVNNELIIEPEESEALISDPTVENSNQRSAKRKNQEKKGQGLTKKCKNESSEDAEKLPYVHVRARRGQATDSHSLAERARREKINARMKLLQDLVPGCSKISGTALVLDEIINHVQSLQRQVEFLSMRLASVNSSIDFDLDAILSTEGGFIRDGGFSELTWPDVVMGGIRQRRQQEWEMDGLNQPGWERGEETQNFITPEHSFLTHHSSAHSGTIQSHDLKLSSKTNKHSIFNSTASLHSNQLKMEL